MSEYTVSIVDNLEKWGKKRVRNTPKNSHSKFSAGVLRCGIHTLCGLGDDTGCLAEFCR